MFEENGANTTGAPQGGFSYYEPKEEKPRKKGTGKKIFLSLLALVLVAAVAFTSGYYGVQTAYGKLDRVVVERVDTGAQAGTATEQPAAAPTDSDELSAKEVAKKTLHSVVAITTEQMTTNNYWFGAQVVGGAGSGVIISEDGYIITNNHVISGADTISVELQDGSTYPATLVGAYGEGDIAVVKIEATGLTPATFADSDKVEQGETVYALGNPEGNFSGSITEGIISALDRQITVAIEDANTRSNDPFGGFFGSSYYYNQSTANLSVFQFDAAVSPGNSGGGLFNAKGELIGIVCAKSSDTDAEGLGFAIMGNKAYEIAASIMSTGSYTPEPSETDPESGTPTNTNKALLGITAAELSEEEAKQYGYSAAGVYVASVTAQSTFQAGLRPGDRIISLDDVIVSQTVDVTGYLADKEPGAQVTLNVERESKLYSFTITLVENTTNN